MKITFLRIGVCLCVILLSAPIHNWKTNNSIKFKFGSLHMHHIAELLFEIFFEDRSNSLCTGAHKRISMDYGYMGAISFLCILTCSVCSKPNEMKQFFHMFKNIFSTEYGINTIYSFLVGFQN